MIEIGGHQLWSNSSVIVDRMSYEKERRKWRHDRGHTPIESVSWGSVIKEATLEQIPRREMDVLDIVEDKHFRVEMSEKEINHVDHNGEFWDEISHKKLDEEGVRNPRLDEIRQFYTHGVYEKVPAQECWNATGKNPIKVKWVDINKGDDVHRESRSRLLAKNI